MSAKTAGETENAKIRMEDVEDDEENILDDSICCIGDVHEDSIGTRIPIKTDNSIENKFPSALILTRMKYFV